MESKFAICELGNFTLLTKGEGVNVFTTYHIQLCLVWINLKSI